YFGVPAITFACASTTRHGPAHRHASHSYSNRRGSRWMRRHHSRLSHAVNSGGTLDTLLISCWAIPGPPRTLYVFRPCDLPHCKFLSRVDNLKPDRILVGVNWPSCDGRQPARPVEPAQNVKLSARRSWCLSFPGRSRFLQCRRNAHCRISCPLLHLCQK